MEKRVTTVGLLSRMSSNKNGKWIVCEHPWLLTQLAAYMRITL